MLLPPKLESGRLRDIMLGTLVEVFSEGSGSPADGGLERKSELPWMLGISYQLTAATGRYL